MRRIEINIIGISDVRWQGTRKIIREKFEIFYSDGTEHERVYSTKLWQKTVKLYWTPSGRV